MIKIASSIKWILLSPEFFVIVLAAILHYLFPSMYGKIGIVASSDTRIELIAFSPIAMLAISWKLARNILLPPEDSHGLLVKWPLYWKLKSRVKIGLLFQVTFCLLGIFAWMFHKSFDVWVTGVMLLVAPAGSFVGICTLYLASLHTAEITKKHST